MKIKNIDGKYWTGEGWGLAHEAAEYGCQCELKGMTLESSDGDVMSLYAYGNVQSWIWETEDGAAVATVVYE